MTLRPIEALATGPQDEAADIRAHLVSARRKLRRNPWAWAAALALHLLVLALAMLVIRFPPSQPVLQTLPGIDVEFDNGGTSAQTAVPAHTQQGPPQQAHPPVPSPPAAPSTPQNRVQMPQMPRTPLPEPPPIPSSESHIPAVRSSHAEEQKYVFLNNMNYGNISSVAPPAPRAPRGMNFSPPMSDMQAARASDFSVKGNAGAGWDAALEKWVQEHAYYPQAALEQNQQGTATVEFTVDRLGHVTGVRLLSSSGSPFLDQAWFQLFAENTLPPFPPDAKSDHVVVRYTVHYQLIP